jgi:5-methylcytosine-specific restriction endonuclease McrA
MKKLKIPVRPKPMITVYEDGRQVLRGEAWRARKFEVWRRDDERCCVCRRPLNFREAEIHHKRSRGMGGCYRNDAAEGLQTLCHECHRRKTPI